MDKNNEKSFQSNDEYCGECGCGVNCNDHDHEHDHYELDYDEMEDFGIIHLTLDDDTELDCNVLGIFEVEDDEYIALLPEGEEEVLIYKYIELDNDEFDLLPIVDEDEFDVVAEAFELLFFDDEDDEVHLAEDEEFVEYENYDELED